MPLIRRESIGAKKFTSRRVMIYDRDIILERQPQCLQYFVQGTNNLYVKRSDIGASWSIVRGR